MSSRVVTALGCVLVLGSVGYAQQPLGDKAPQQPPAALPPAQGAAAPTAVFGAAPADSSADNAYIEELKTKKVIYRANVKGKLASLLVGEAFTNMNEEERTKIVKLAYKSLVVANDPKFKSPMTIILSDGRRLGPRLGVYTITARGESVKFVKPRAVAGPVGGPNQFCPGGVPTCPGCPPVGAFFCP